MLLSIEGIYVFEVNTVIIAYRTHSLCGGGDFLG